MRPVVPSLCAVVLTVMASGAGAQVFRCGNSTVYTDKPCHGASAVDVRPNLLEAGTRRIPADPPPAPAIIMPAAPRTTTEPTSGNELWNRRDAAEAEYRGRTGPYQR